MAFDVLAIRRELMIIFTVEGLQVIYDTMKNISDANNTLHEDIKILIEEKKSAPQNLELQDGLENMYCDLYHCRYQENLRDFEEHTCPVCITAFDYDRNLKDVVVKRQKRQLQSQKKPGISKAKPRGSDITGYRPKPGPNQISTQVWLDHHDEQIKPRLSSKAQAVQSILRNIDRQTPNDKIIIFVQWVQAAIHIGTMLAEEGTPFVYYWGGMGQAKRLQAAEKMEKDDSCKIMICGLKVGSLGLNWIWANHVIMTDPWWNKSVETQAFCRAYRFGQSKETNLTKVYVHNSVDQRLQDMQITKSMAIAQTTPNELTSDEWDLILYGNRTLPNRL